MASQVIRFTGSKVEPIYPIEGGQSALAFMPNITIVAGTVLGQVSSANANEVQTLNVTGTVNRGTFTVAITGIDGGTYTTSALAYNITNANLKVALDALLDTAGYEGATVTIGGGPMPTDATVTFGGTAANWNMPLMVATAGATFDDAAATPVLATLSCDATTAGNRVDLWGAYSDILADGRQVAKAIADVSFRTDNFGRVILADAGSGPEYGIYFTTAPAWFKGRFKTSQLTGLDAAAVADLGRLESGTVADGILALI